METMKFPRKPILLIDDEEHFLFTAAYILNASGLDNIIQCSDPRQVEDIVQEKSLSVIVMDVIMPHIHGTELLKSLREEHPEIPVIMLTALNDVDTAVECMQAGAFNYLVKPVEETRLVTTIKRALEFSQIRSQNRRLKEYLLTGKLKHPEAFQHIVTQNAHMRSIFQYIEAISATPFPILITGETGVGKELIAKSIHQLSGRTGQFTPVNVAGVDDNLFSDTLFGHIKGSFTGALADRKGLIEQATGGTLFLDEIGDLGLESQVKLLRLLQEGKYLPLGSDRDRTSNARIVVATNADLGQRMQEGHFRKDLFFRLQAHHIKIPSLRERKDDIPLLTKHFLIKASDQLGIKDPTPPKELSLLLKNYDFPGNIRELEGMVFDAVSQHQSGVLSMQSFREKIFEETGAPHITDSGPEMSDTVGFIFPEKLPSLKEMELKLIDEAMRRADGNQRIAAEMLGLTRRALNNRLRRNE